MGAKLPLQSKQPILLTEKEAGKILGFSVRSLQKWRVRGSGPNFIKLSPKGPVRYREADLISFIDERVRRSTSGPGNVA